MEIIWILNDMTMRKWWQDFFFRGNNSSSPREIKMYCIYFVSALCYFCGEQFIHASQSTKKCFIIFNPNLNMLLPFKMMGLLWWHQFDGLGMSVTSLTTPLQLSVLYYIQSIRCRKKTSHAFYFLIQYSVSLGSTSQYGSKNGRKLPVHVDFKP